MGGLHKEDTPHASGDIGSLVLAVRLDTGASLAGTDGDYAPLQVDASGLLRVGGTITVGQTIADDAEFTAASRVMPSGFLADETASDSVDEGDIGIARMTLDRKIHVVSEFESNSIRAGGTSLTPKFAAIAAATSGDNSIVALVSSKKIRVLAMFLVAGAAGNIYFTSNTGGTVIFGGSTNKIQLAANGGFVLPFNPLGWFETAAGQALNMNASSTGPFSGGLTYCEV